METKALLRRQRSFFDSGKTLDIHYRLAALNALEQAVREYEPKLSEALFSDLGKSRAESYMCEIGLTLSELRYMKKHLRSFAAKRLVLTPLAQFPSQSFTVQEPYGVVLIMSPWNYPVLLTLEPLIEDVAGAGADAGRGFPGRVCGGDRGRQSRKSEFVRTKI